MFFNIFNKKKNKEKNFYFGLILKEEEGCGIVIEINELTKTVRNIDEKIFKYSNGWEYLVEDVDQVLYDLEQRNNLKLHNIIFFLYSHLVDQNNKQIKKNYSQRIKSIADKLEIKPLGFIEYHEAIATYQSEQDEAPLTSIIVELDKPVVSVFIYKSGELFFSDSVGKTEDIVTDLEAIFTKIQGTVLPARIILYDSSSLIAESHKISSHKFKDGLFIQLPKVEILREQDVIASLLNSFSNQFFNKNTEQPNNVVQQADIMGFVIGEDIAKEIKLPINDVPTLRRSAVETNKERDFSEFNPTENFFQKTVSSVSTIFKKPDIFSNKTPMKVNISIFAIVAFLIIGFFLIALLYFFHKATVVIYYQGKKEQKEMTMQGSLSGGGTDTLVIKKSEQSVDQTEQIDTTGKKTIGQKAAGLVTIYNKDTSDKIFKKGDTLTSQSGVIFLFDSDVKIASASESLTSEGNVLTVTGKAKAQVTAQDIGPSGNLSKGEKLKLGDFSVNLFFALVETSLTGGTKEDVKTVSKDDIDTLKEKIKTKMKVAKNEAQSKVITDSEKRIDSLTDVTILDEKYSKEVGEQADSVSLHAKGKITIYQYDDTVLKLLIAKQFKSTIPANYDLSPSNISYTISDSTKKDTQAITLNLSVIAQLVPKINMNTIKQLIVGKTEHVLQLVIKDDLKAQRFTMNVDTPIPFLKTRLPFFKRNIEVKIDSL